MEPSQFAMMIGGMMSDEIPLSDETYRILGACFEVYNELGCGFLEAVYQECLAIELGSAGIPFEQQNLLGLSYKGRTIKKSYVVDFVCFNEVLVEIKAVSRLTGEHRAQTLNYLHAGDFDIGLLINFGHFPKIEYQRLLNRRLQNVFTTESKA